MQTSGAGSAAQAARVLVVDDERDIAELVAAHVTKAGYVVAEAYSGPDAVAAARQMDPDVIVLDLGLPGFDGVEVCRQVRTFSECYILMLTARGDEISRVVGLSVGADDYITKPFSALELLARIQAVLRRPWRSSQSPREQAPEEPPRAFGDLTIDSSSREVEVSGRRVALTRTEFDILDVLSSRPRHVFSRRQIIDEVWDTGWVGDDHIVDVHIGHLRSKLDDSAATATYVETVRGVGYRMGKG
ncbi:response regulator transcription factor [Intrasporangium calvum]|uniref:Response regulator transcription factor n=1 Tax=Intrasporangium calvum TaxID=53358 RepID=A0ABT5GJD2_9MICO|nr:response regulator transcription factor [Intrasporangium calvum]MDC5697975.1 response regulator transcription factor [Intrasporangium calvum]